MTMVAHDTTYVSGAIQHDGLLEHQPWYYGSNSYVDLSVHYLNDSNKAHFHELRATTRLEMTQWPLPGFDKAFAGHGIGHLSVAAAFDFGEITVGDVYGQFGSGLILNLYEDRSLGIDGALRGAKFDILPYRGIHLTMLGGKQRRFWNCYQDRAWGWNYAQDAVMGADLELHLEQWSQRMRELDMNLTIGGSYVSKHEQFDSIYVMRDDGMCCLSMPTKPMTPAMSINIVIARAMRCWHRSAIRAKVWLCWHKSNALITWPSARHDSWLAAQGWRDGLTCFLHSLSSTPTPSPHSILTPRSTLTVNGRFRQKCVTHGRVKPEWEADTAPHSN